MSRKSYRICGFDCAACALKSEKHLNKNENIEEAVIDFAKDRLHISFKDKELSPDELKAIIAEVEDDPIQISDLSENVKPKTLFTKENIFKMIRIAIATVVIVLDFVLFMAPNYFWYAFGISTGALFLVAYEIYWAVIKNIKAKVNPIDEHLLLTMCSIGAFVVGVISKEAHIFADGLMVVALYEVGEIIKGLATNKSKAAISSAIELRVNTANKVVGSDVKEVSPEELKVGDLVIVSIGERIPVDGVIKDGEAEIDTSSLTGEFVPVMSEIDKEVYAGCLIKSGSIKIEVTREYKDSAVSKIIELISSSGAKKSKADEFVTKFARWYTPLVLLVAVLTLVIGGAITKDWNTWVILGLKMLIVGCPCAIVISVPLAYFSSLGLASKNGIVIKGTNYLDSLSELRKVVSDKTGTLTKGVFEISKVNPVNCSKEELMEYLVAAEYLSNHPIAKAICKHQNLQNYGDLTDNYEEFAGLGVSIEYKGNFILAGNAGLLKSMQVEFTEADEFGSIVYVSKDNDYLGYVVLSDEIKEESYELTKALKSKNVELVLLTGDKKENAKQLCAQLGIEKYYAELLPEDKISHLENEMNSKGKVAFVGDGINDAACIKEADIGIAMGGIGSDAAVENADVVIMNDNPRKIFDAFRISKIARHTSIFNIIFALFIKISIELAAFLTSLLGHSDAIPMWAAVIADTGLTVVLVINSLLILYRKLKHKSV